MDHFIHNENIRHFKKLLEDEQNQEKRAIIGQLLAEEEAKGGWASPQASSKNPNHL